MKQVEGGGGGDQEGLCLQSQDKNQGHGEYNTETDW